MASQVEGYEVIGLWGQVLRFACCLPLRSLASEPCMNG